MAGWQHMDWHHRRRRWRRPRADESKPPWCERLAAARPFTTRHEQWPAVELHVHVRRSSVGRLVVIYHLSVALRGHVGVHPTDWSRQCAVCSIPNPVATRVDSDAGRRSVFLCWLHHEKKGPPANQEIDQQQQPSSSSGPCTSRDTFMRITVGKIYVNCVTQTNRTPTQSGSCCPGVRVQCTRI